MSTNLTPEQWQIAMLSAIDNYHEELEAWKAHPNESTERRLQLAGAHCDHIEGLRPGPLWVVYGPQSDTYLQPRVTQRRIFDGPTTAQLYLTREAAEDAIERVTEFAVAQHAGVGPLEVRELPCSPTKAQLEAMVSAAPGFGPLAIGPNASRYVVTAEGILEVQCSPGATEYLVPVEPDLTRYEPDAAAQPRGVDAIRCTLRRFDLRVAGWEREQLEAFVQDDLPPARANELLLLHLEAARRLQ